MIIYHDFGFRAWGLRAILCAGLALTAVESSQAQDARSAAALSRAEAGLRHALQVGDDVEAIRFAREALEHSDEAHGRHHPNTAARLVDLATLLHGAGDTVAAAERYLEAEAVYTALFGPVSPQHIDLQLRLAALYPPQTSARRRHALAAVQTQRSLAPEDQLIQARVALRAGELLAEQVGGNSEAEQMLEEALRAYESHYGRDAQELIPMLAALADASARRGDARNQLRHYDRALRIVRDHHGNDSEAYADLALRAARHSLLLSITDSGRSHLRNAQTIYGRRLGANPNPSKIRPHEGAPVRFG